MKQAYKIIGLVIIFTCAISLKALALDELGDTGSDVPIDGGLSLLVAAGVGYGAKKAKQFRKK